MLNRLKVLKTQEEQTLNKHKQVILHTIMINFFNVFRRTHVFVCLFSPKVQKILQYFFKEEPFSLILIKKNNTKTQQFMSRFFWLCSIIRNTVMFHLLIYMHRCQQKTLHLRERYDEDLHPGNVNNIAKES